MSDHATKFHTQHSLPCVSETLQQEFRNEVSERGPLDIDDLSNLLKNLETCPYYGSRISMVLIADLVVLPYQSLLSKSSCEAP